MTSPRKLLSTPKTNLICDFDGTLTTSSTLNILASIGYSRNNPATTTPWSEITSAYMRDLHHHHHHNNNNNNNNSNNNSNNIINNIRTELEYQNTLRPVERASIERIEEAGIFKNVTPSDLIHGATKAVEEGNVRFRTGWDGLVRKVTETGGRIEIVSVNWSRVFIRAAIDAGAFSGVGVGSSSSDDFGIGIAANDIEEDGSGRLTRPFSCADGGIWTAEDKVRLVREIVVRVHGSVHAHDHDHARTIYVGDSPTDLGSLIEPGVIGIAIQESDDLDSLKSDQKDLKTILDKSENVQVKHIGEWDAGEWERGQVFSSSFSVSGSVAKKVLYWARDFAEISRSPLFVS